MSTLSEDAGLYIASGRPADRIMRYIPADVLAGLSPAQRQAIRRALTEAPWQNYPVDIRFTVNLPFSPFFVTILAGPERRDAGRRAADRRRHPFNRPGNLLFLLAVVLLASLAGAAGIAILDAIR